MTRISQHDSNNSWEYHRLDFYHPLLYINSCVCTSTYFVNSAHDEYNITNSAIALTSVISPHAHFHYHFTIIIVTDTMHTAICVHMTKINDKRRMLGKKQQNNRAGYTNHYTICSVLFQNITDCDQGAWGQGYHCFLIRFAESNMTSNALYIIIVAHKTYPAVIYHGHGPTTDARVRFVKTYVIVYIVELLFFHCFLACFSLDPYHTHTVCFVQMLVIHAYNIIQSL